MSLKVNGNSFSKDKFNRLVDLVYSSLVNGGTGYKVRRNSGGTVLDIKPGTGGSTTHPYKGINASSDGTPKVRVTPGTHNGVVPTINGVELTNDPPPELTLGSVAKIVYAQLNLNANSGAIESVIINSSNDIAPPAGDSVTVYQILFFVTMDDGQLQSINQNVSGSQAYQSCAGQNLFGLL